MNNDETKISVSFQNKISGSNLATYTKRLKELYGVLSAIDQGKLEQIGDINLKVIKTKDSATQLNQETTKLHKNLNLAFGLGKITLFTKKFINLSKGFLDLTKKSSDYVENINLLEVAYSNVNRKTGEFNEDIKTTSQRIEGLINKMSDVFGLDESRLAKSFGIFKQLANAMELPVETGEQLSELMVKMSNDIASLYNLDLNRASNALQSALAGQVRPIRTATGADITEKTLQKTVDALGLDTTINKLSFVEKRLIMVISLTNQLKNSQGDYGRTIESVANQTRIMSEQWDRLTRAFGNMFYPIAKKVLPIVNGILMALTEIANIIASLLGFQMEEFDYSGLAGVSDYANDISEEFDNAGKNVDKLKRKMSGLRSFDQLNVITTPKSTSSSGGVGSGINSKILDAFSKAFDDYDDMLDKVKMKANDIRDSIMEWLGFTKKINPLTGEIEWKYEGLSKTLGNMWKSFKNMNPLLKIFTSFALWKSFKLLFTWGGKLLNLFGIGGLAKSIKNVFTDLSNINNDLPTISSKMDRFTTAIVGVSIAILGREGLVNALEEINKEGPSATRILEATISGLGEIAGFTMIGASIGGPGGAGVGLGLGILTTIITAIENTKDEYDTLISKTKEALEPTKQFFDNINQQFDQIDKDAEQKQSVISIYQAMFEELQRIVDENGRVKAGYEDRAEFIVKELNSAFGVEMKLIDGVIQKYDEQVEAIQRVIDKKRLAIYEEKARAKYEIAIENETKALADYEKLQTRWNELEEQATYYAQQMYKAIEEGNDELAWKYSELNAKARAEQEGMKDALQSAKDYWNEQKEIIDGYGKVVGAVTKGNIEQAQLYTEELLNGTKKEEGIFRKKMREAKLFYDDHLEYVKKTNGEILESDKVTASERFRIAGQYLVDHISSLKEDTEDYVGAWKDLAENSTTEFLNYFKKLPENMRQDVISEMYNLGYELSDELQKGVSAIQPEIKFKTNLKGVANTINNFFSKLKINAPKTGIVELDKSIEQITNLANGFISGTQKFITNFENGGMPKVGNLFLMNEKEPELLGTVGGKSFVANQSQMMDLLDRKIGNAQKNTGTQVINLYLDADHKIGSYTIEQLQNMAKTDGKPITIGG